MRLSKPKIARGQTLTASVTVRNSGHAEGTETVQLYIRDLVGSVTRPVKELKAYQRVRLKPGTRRKVSFTIGEGDLAFYRADMTYGAEPGDFLVFIGGSFEQVKEASFQLLE